MRKFWYTSLLLALLVLPFTEVYLWLTDRDIPWSYPFIPEVGWVNLPGLRDTDEEPGVYEMFWDDGQRASRYPREKKAPYHVACLGCSYTKGTGVRDEETFVWRLNERFPDIVFDNYGVSGYGPYQCLSVLNQLLERHEYDRYIYFAIDDHINRFVQPLPFWLTEFSNDQLSVMPWVEEAYSPESGVAYNVYHPTECRAWPGARTFRSLYFFNCLAIYCDTQAHPMPQESVRLAIHERTVQEMQKACTQRHIPFSVVVLEDGKENLMPNSSTLEFLDATYPLDNTKFNPRYRIGGIPENHPNHLVHNYWAHRIAKWIDAEWSDR